MQYKYVNIGAVATVLDITDAKFKMLSYYIYVTARKNKQHQ